MKAGVLWTGGKDSSLALYKAISLGYQVPYLVTFTPKNPRFLAHPIEFMKLQAEALELSHLILEINKPFKKSYEEAISSLKEQRGISTLITGDIALVNGHANWIKECSKHSGVEVVTPLWDLDRQELIEKLIILNFKIIISLVKKPWFTGDWLGKELNHLTLERLLKINAGTGLDICGEQGEYHTLVLDGPLFKKSIQIISFSRCIKDSLMYMDIGKAILKEKLKFL